MVDVHRENNSQVVNVVPVDNTQNVPVQPVSTDTKVSGTNDKTKYYSDLAKHYAELAEDYADNADTSADNALVSATSADNSAGICTSVLENEHFQTVYTDLESENSDIEAVGNNIENVNAIASDLINIDTVKDNLTAINTNATNIVDIQNASSNAQTAITKASEALQSANNAHSSEVNAGVSEDNAEIWAEGTDEEVQLLGGVHSSKGWAYVSSQGQIQTDWLQSDNTQKDYIKNKPTNLSDFTDDLGSSPAHTHSQYLTSHQDISGKLAKSGDKMIGTLEFDKSLKGLTESTNPCMLMNFDHIIDADNLPDSHIYGNCKIMIDSAGKLCFREYDRYSNAGLLTHYIQVTNYDAEGIGHSATLGLSVNNAGDIFFSFPMCATKPTTTSTASTSRVIVGTKNYLNGEAGYVKYSDGLIIQWGKTAEGASQEVTLLQSYSNANYFVGTTQYYSNSVAADYGAIMSKTKAKFTMKGYSTVSFGWFAIGY